jgi:uncharacterized protein
MKFNFKSLLSNDQENRLRAFWRIFTFLILYFICTLLIAFLISLSKPYLSSPYQQLLRYLLNASVLTALIWMMGAQIDIRSLTSFGLKLDKTWFKEFAIGVGIASGVSIFMYLTGYLFGWFEISGWGWVRVSTIPFFEMFILYLLMMLCVGYYEELVFRGYIGLNLFEGFNGKSGESPLRGAIISIATVSILFAIAHANNPNFTYFSLSNIFLAGIMLGWPYFFSGSLALPVGLHFAWNFVQGPVLGLPVSGIIFTSSMVQTSRVGPDIITGGKFGIEGGLMGSVALLLVVILTWWLMKNRYDTLRVNKTLLR